jgi:hypothetical protein
VRPSPQLRLVAAAAASAALVACHDVSDFSTASGGVFEGPITSASFVRAGLGASVRMCLSIDTTQLQVSPPASPGAVSTSDGLFTSTPLRGINQFWADPLSTFNFGEGRIQNVLYVATGNATDAAASGDVTVVISFMVGGNVEVRLLRGASGPPTASPASPAPDGAAPDSGAAGPPQVFGVFALSRQTGSCPF